MSEWWTYGLSDFLMFSPRTWWRMVDAYNRDWWPLHLGALAAGALAVWRYPSAPFVLAAAWLWVGWAFHWERHAAINLAAPWFAGAFAVQAVLLLATRAQQASRMGVAVAVAGLAAYPLLGPATGRPMEVFGLAPDPTALVTLGLARRWWLRVIPAASLLASGLTRLAMGG